MVDQPRLDVQGVSSSNSLGKAGLIVAVLGAAFFVATIWAVEGLQRDKRGQQSKDAALLGIGQALLLGAGCIAGGVANLVSLGLSSAGLRRQPRWPAMAGLALSFLGPALVVGWWLLVVESRMQVPAGSFLDGGGLLGGAAVSAVAGETPAPQDDMPN